MNEREYRTRCGDGRGSTWSRRKSHKRGRRAPIEDGTEPGPGARRRRKPRPFRLMVQTPRRFWRRESTWRWGAYATRRAAEQALSCMQRTHWLKPERAWIEAA